jgi:hypothetical protein
VDVLLTWNTCQLCVEEGHFTGEGNLCDQEGCGKEAEVTLKVKKEYPDGDGRAQDPYTRDRRPLIRKFCATHATRGDTGYGDEDDNYERLEGKI